MKSEESVKDLFASKKHADGFEQKAKKSNWIGPEVVFGLSYGHIDPQDTILDIGIGTGLSSLLYYKAGLKVYGIDNSQRMLEACAAKRIAEDLQQHDLLQVPYPYGDHSIHHAISAGVFHIFNDLSPIFSEVARIIMPKGIFVFTVMDYKSGEEQTISMQSDEYPGKNFTIYRYNETEIDELLAIHGFVRLKVLEFFVNHAQKRTRLSAYLAQRS